MQKVPLCPCTLSDENIKNKFGTKFAPQFPPSVPLSGQNALGRHCQLDAVFVPPMHAEWPGSAFRQTIAPCAHWIGGWHQGIGQLNVYKFYSESDGQKKPLTAVPNQKAKQNGKFHVGNGQCLVALLNELQKAFQQWANNPGENLNKINNLSKET